MTVQEHFFVAVVVVVVVVVLVAQSLPLPAQNLEFSSEKVENVPETPALESDNFFSSYFFQVCGLLEDTRRSSFALTHRLLSNFFSLLLLYFSPAKWSPSPRPKECAPTSCPRSWKSSTPFMMYPICCPSVGRAQPCSGTADLCSLVLDMSL